VGTPRADVPSVGLSALPNPGQNFIPVARVTEMQKNPGGDYDFNGRVLTQDVGTSRLGQGRSAQSCLVEVEVWREAVPPVRAHLVPAIA